MKQTFFHTEIVELGQGEFLAYLSIAKTQFNTTDGTREGDCRDLLGTNHVIISEDTNLVRVFRNEKDQEHYKAFAASADRYIVRHVFYNLNKYGSNFLPDNKEIVNSFLTEISCFEPQRKEQIKWFVSWANRHSNPILIYRRYIAEFTLLVHLYYLEQFPDLRFTLEFEQNTFIPYLVSGNDKYFILPNLYSTLFVDNDYLSTLGIIEIGYSRLLRLFPDRQ